MASGFELRGPPGVPEEVLSHCHCLPPDNGNELDVHVNGQHYSNMSD